VIAEGVDTEYQVAMLRAGNVDAVQGFYFSRPLDTASLFAFHRERMPR
jgi:EAL domain-containing protein (putative c-di-GMP-specific phosphodiesterase class I)